MKLKLISIIAIVLIILYFISNRIKADEKELVNNPAGYKKGTSYMTTVRSGVKFTEQQIEFMVSHFDIIMVKGWFGKRAIDKVRGIAKVLNRNFKILQYTNPMFDLAYKPTNEKAYAHSSSGKRIKETEYAQGWNLMDLCCEEWREFFLQQANKKIDDFGLDGIFLDDMGMASGLSKVKRIDALPGRLVGNAWRKYSDDEWYQCGYDFLDYVKSNLEDKIVVFNGLYHRPPQYDVTLLEVSDGGMREGFILTGHYDRFFNEADWKKLLNQIIKDIDKYNKRFFAFCRMEKRDATTGDRMFCFTSYLLINQPGLVIYSSPKYSYDLYYFPEMDVDPGIPTQDAATLDGYYDSSSQLYIRKYSQGMVVVNPSSQTRRLMLPRPYYLVIPHGGGIVKANGTHSGGLDYKEVSEVAIPSQTGIILLDKIPGSI